jgi:chemotaxis signal transduction protein
MTTIQDVVTFAADGALYAVPVGRVQEILDLRPTAAMQGVRAISGVRQGCVRAAKGRNSA